MTNQRIGKVWGLAIQDFAQGFFVADLRLLVRVGL
jgi:hypothetical protein